MSRCDEVLAVAMTRKLYMLGVVICGAAYCALTARCESFR
jgi:hypothetical protein